MNRDIIERMTWLVSVAVVASQASNDDGGTQAYLA